MKTIICIASGPSLTKDDVEYCRGKGIVYAVKECRHLAPWADVLYAADLDWWEKFDGCKDFAGERWTCTPAAAEKFGLHHIEYDSKLIWSDKPGIIATGGNSGFQVMNLSVLRHPDAERMILLGYDMGFIPGTDKHWWEQKHPRTSRDSNYHKWLDHLDKAAPMIPIPVLNATPTSAIRCFPKVNLRNVL